ncbi:Lysine exporter protein (LYSE/YGGA) [Catenulispora acidiphila DSM 44928]|uniref:Lysine exporter protein (LYSE/YGGA) n=1 Tax=Catenulispora acidiphila (strain DSM 44928 / JCM 14897 / NBRC 102108 / NRRL B-24433 / ID139908) TaxID=479433 RepID=C7Q4Q4_CATAD|nr:leucine efflux protein LeuE [Catenulispora acidiphila]ACU72023.1 Lysine exporter protein (LYSE/YGGA) [Catenulispora acidiphila DSM 44928]
MLGTVDLPTFVLGALLIVLLPGPNSLYVLTVGARKGVRTGYRAASGVFLGDAVLLTLTAAGAASMLKRSPATFDVVKFLGAGYLAWLGFGMLRAAVKAWRRRAAAPVSDTDAAAMAEAVEAAERPFRRALVVSLLNPKAILFDLAFLTQFVSPHAAHPTEAFALLSTIVMLFSAGYLSVLIFTGHRLATAFRRRKRLAASMTGGIGSLFLGFALKLATASLGAA